MFVYAENMSFAMASAIPLVGLTALQALEGAEVAVSRNRQPSSPTPATGLNVLILGASGGTGHVALQIAKARGHRVTAVCGSRNREWVDSLGNQHEQYRECVKRRRFVPDMAYFACIRI
jgi:NADPH:quinone reductase-like Zn-dependent oxidoreductase